MSTSLMIQTKQEDAIRLVTDAVDSQGTKEVYRYALLKFFHWVGDAPVNRAAVHRYRDELQQRGLAASTINTRLSAIRKLAREARYNGYLTADLAYPIEEIKNIKETGVREGNWLSREQVRKLLNAPDGNTLKGLRDRAILAVLVGAGLRCSECAGLQFKHLKQVDGSWAIVDIVGKGNKIRTVPIANWVKEYIDEWAEAANISEGFVFRSMRRGDHLAGENISRHAIWEVVKGYGVAPHDLRRTFSKLARKGGAPLEQLQFSLGHDSLKTTQVYLGIDQDFQDSPSRRLQIYD